MDAGRVVARTDLESRERGSGSCQSGSEPKREHSDSAPTHHPFWHVLCGSCAQLLRDERREDGRSGFANHGVESVLGWPWVVIGLVDARRGRSRSGGEVALELRVRRDAAAGWNTFCGEGKVAGSFEQWDRLGVAGDIGL